MVIPAGLRMGVAAVVMVASQPVISGGMKTSGVGTTVIVATMAGRGGRDGAEAADIGWAAAGVAVIHPTMALVSGGAPAGAGPGRCCSPAGRAACCVWRTLHQATLPLKWLPTSGPYFD